MRSIKSLVLCSIAAAVLAACGGGGNGDQTPQGGYTSVVSFGDSLSDAGTFKAGVMANVTAGAAAGQFTVNGIAGAVGSDPVPTYTWAQLVAAAAVGTPSCAARSGGFGVVEVVVAGCSNYAQGGSRVTSAFGVGNTVGAGNVAGPLTEPVVTQVANYLVDANNGGKFKGTELVTVLAGANDIFGQTDILKTGVGNAAATALITSLVTQLVAGLGANAATAAPAIQSAATTAVGGAFASGAAAGNSLTAIITAATGAGTQAAATAAGVDAATHAYTNANLANAATIIPATAGAAAGAAATSYASGAGAQTAVVGMVTAANELVASINGMITNGAKRIVVANLPDVSQTPMSMATVVKDSNGVVTDNSQQQLVLAMTTAFNDTLAAGLANKPEVLFVDVFSENKRQHLNPAQYGISNTKDVACNLAAPSNPGASSLFCNTTNLVPGDTSHYLFADMVHPTPYGHKLLSQYITNSLLTAGWL